MSRNWEAFLHFLIRHLLSMSWEPDVEESARETVANKTDMLSPFLELMVQGLKEAEGK